MSTWSTGVYDSDTSSEVKDFYRECLQNQMDSLEAENAVIQRFFSELSDEDDRIQVILALANMEWDYGRLSDKIRDEALQIINDGADVLQWNEVDERFGKKRNAVLTRLKDKLSSQQPKEKKVRRPTVFQCSWNIGDVYAVQMKSEYARQKQLYDSWLVLQNVNQADNLKDGLSPVVTIRFAASIETPILQILENPCIRVNRYLGYKWSYRMHLLLYTKRSISDFQFLGNSELVLPEDDYPHSNNTGYQMCMRKFLEQTAISDYFEFGTENKHC